MRILPYVILMMGIAGCGRAEGESPRPAAGRLQAADEAVKLARVDRSTPDLALKSYWRFRAVEDSLTRLALEPMYTEPWKAARRSFFGGTALEEVRQEQARESYSREIVEVKQETASRAAILVRVRNTTSVPPGTVPEELAQRLRGEGEMYRFIMERDGTGWTIAQVQSWNEYRKAWSDRFGTGPHVPSWTTPY